jgi:endonuclease YncB( thermonuclease family)
MTNYLLVTTLVLSFSTSEIQVLDGDTFKVHGQSYRLEKIDAPELGQDYGLESKLKLQSLIKEGGGLNCLPTTHHIGKSYNRIVLSCHRHADQLPLSELMLSSGSAWLYHRDDQRLLSLELSSRKNKFGLWAEHYSVNRIPPWEYRRMNRNAK